MICNILANRPLSRPSTPASTQIYETRTDISGYSIHDVAFYATLCKGNVFEINNTTYGSTQVPWMWSPGGEFKPLQIERLPVLLVWLLKYISGICVDCMQAISIAIFRRMREALVRG